MDGSWEEAWRMAMLESFKNFTKKVITFLPNLLAMLTILAVGFLFAWLVKALLVYFLRAIHFDRLSERWGLTNLLSKGGVNYSPSHLVSRFFFWFFVLITLILGINSLEVAATQKLITQFFMYLPNVFAALLILIVGYLIALFLSQATLIAAVNAQIDSASLLSRTVRWFIMILILTMALYHLGVAEKVIVAAFSILLGGIVLALAVAFGWGGREIAKEFLERLARKKKEKEERRNNISHL